jgi:phthiodiolone/phenolphthiodiolone dimycocerosates ketoreductase
MSGTTVEIDMPIWLDRYAPVEAVLEQAKLYEASGVVDYLQGWDQLTSWWPSLLWTPENFASHTFQPDPDSFPDWVSMLSAAAAVAPELGTVISTDSIRRGPAELMQTMLTMANITRGRSQFHFGAGEVKQTRPFGWKRSEGLKRLEDLLQAFKLFSEKDEPIDLDGQIWKLDSATIGYARPHKPQIWGLGGGPKILELSTTYADGFATMAPFVAFSPENWADEWVGSMKRTLETKDRDPDAFQFGIYAAVLIHEDEELIESALANPLIRWVGATMGRILQSDWRKQSIEPPMPDDWHYAMKMLPKKYTQPEIDEILARVTPEISRKSWIVGSPKQVAAQLQAYIDAGATWISLIDTLPVAASPEEAMKAPQRAIEVASILKGAAARSSTQAPGDRSHAR